MKKIQKLTLLILALCNFAVVYSQQKVIIRGRVVDKNDKSVIIGANVIEYDKDNRVINGTICDVNGDFVLQMKDGKDIVKVSFMGYNTLEVKVDPSQPMTIELEPTVRVLEELVVTALAQSKRPGLTNLDDRDKASSSVRVDLRDMKEAGALTVADALQGRVSGLDILNASGDPGTGSRIVIRGLSSIGNSKPLIVIDGIPQSDPPNYKDVNLAAANVEDIGTLINISVQDIKSVEILKDAASTAAYGSNGSDGVLLIETHKGRKGNVHIEYTYKKSYDFQPPAIPMLNGDEYVIMQNEEWFNSKPNATRRAEIDPNNTDLYIRNNYTKNTDWIGEITQNGISNDHYINLSGGGEKATYFTSLSYLDEVGTTINTGAKTFSTRINLDYLLSEKIFFNIHFSYTHKFTDGNFSINNKDIREMAYIKAPNMSIWEYDSYGNLTGEYFTPATKDNYQGDGFNYFNPVAVARLGKNDKVNNALMNSFTLRYKLLPWLTLNETASIEIKGEKQNAYLPYKAVGIDWLDWRINKADEQNQINQSIKTQTQLLYTIPFTNKKHQLAGALTWNTDDGRYENMRVESNKTPSTDIQDPAINAQINYIGSYLSQTRQLQGVVSVNYKYDDRYLLQTILTRDAHTAFGVNNRWGTFYGISAAWRFSKEPLLMDYASILGESKIKISYGSSGRKPDGSYDRFATYGSSGNAPSGYLDYLAVVPLQIQLSNLKWETQASWNIGLDLNLFDDRFNSTLEFYKKRTTDLLFGGWTKEYKIPRSSGFDYLKWFNGGELKNRGWEVMMDYKIIKKKDLLVSVNFNISQNENSFTKLPPNYNNEKSVSIGNGEYPQVITEGEPIGSFYGFRFLGVYSTDADAVAKDVDGNTIYDITGTPIPMTYKGTYPFKGGDAKYEDVNHDGKIDLNDVVYIGNSNPKFYGGFGPVVRYKNFSASCHFQFRTGYDIINYIALQTQGMNDYNNQSNAVLRRWRTSGQNEPNLLPRAYLNHPANNLGSDRYVEKGDFLRLLNVQVGYKVSSKVCEKIHLRSLSATLSARKIGTWTNYSGQDPEVSQDASDPFWIGVDKSKTPPSRVVTFALSVGF